MIVSVRWRFVYLGMKRTGSVATEATLLEKLPGAVRCGKRHDVEVPRAFRRFKKLAVHRNPYAREYSLYCYAQKNSPAHPLKRRVKRMTFREYVLAHVSGKLDRPGEPWDLPLATLTKALVGVLWLPFEEMPVCMEAELKRLTGASLSLYRRNKAMLGDWRGQYDEELAGQVAQYAAPDFAAYGYDTESWRE